MGLLPSATDRGLSAFIAGTPQCANPYLPNTPEHTAWDGGWKRGNRVTRCIKQPFTAQSVADEVIALLNEGATVHVIHRGKVAATYAPGDHGPVRLADGAGLAHN